MELSTKNELLQKLRSYATAPDEHGILWKEKIKNNLMNCPELLFALNNSDYEDQLFDEQGNIMWDGEWDRYFGPSSSIRPFIFIRQHKLRSVITFLTPFLSIRFRVKIGLKSMLKLLLKFMWTDAMVMLEMSAFRVMI